MFRGGGVVRATLGRLDRGRRAAERAVDLHVAGTRHVLAAERVVGLDRAGQMRSRSTLEREELGERAPVMTRLAKADDLDRELAADDRHPNAGPGLRVARAVRP